MISEFYPGQSFLEDGGFIPILRTQTKMTWRHERTILPRHGMRSGIAMADICCGIGDFAVLVQKEFQPVRIVALDHSKSSLAYARNVAAEFDIRGIEYTYGDASEMLLEDNEFDSGHLPALAADFQQAGAYSQRTLSGFASRGAASTSPTRRCRSAWANRAAKPSSGPMTSFQSSSPTSRWIWKWVQRTAGTSLDAGFEDIRAESFMVTNLDGDPQEFADIVQSWEDTFAGEMSRRRGDSPEFAERFRQGFQDHIFAALHPKGYAGWPVWVASGRKPL